MVKTSFKQRIQKKGRHRILRHWELQVMVLPSIVFILIMSYIPMWGVLFAFQDYDIFAGFLHSPWVGLKHVRALLDAPVFWDIMRNTVVISFLRLLILFPAPIILALMLNEIRKQSFKRVVQTITYLPHFLSWVIIGGFVASFLAVDNGTLNITLMKLNLIQEPMNWLSISNYFWTILISTNLWKEVGFGSIVYLAAIAGVDPHLYEAASVDGASRTKQIFLVTIPCISPVISVFLILQLGRILDAGFEDILVLTNNGINSIVNNVAEVIDTYAYKIGLGDQRYSYGAAVGLFKSVINVFLLFAANGVARRLGRSSLF
ncbi:ABC transporter permease [Paenibacillus roseipurpureus]|uniref:ABC transporter permease subunit n=1 Tax=Paenibacillus roseopurpureus TaxID=2918901 RepID=A0AA96LTI1_9BACL|nr:ABC transporter permease subunit [Paenibacillus sp. MBLB1832]WNR47048.1 ABC transporter permease subunit [Paenibacillus sp. MBLB1832]